MILGRQILRSRCVPRCSVSVSHDAWAFREAQHCRPHVGSLLGKHSLAQVLPTHTQRRAAFSARPDDMMKTWKDKERLKESNENLWWVATGLVGVFGLCWTCVPLYKLYCQSTGQGQANAVGHKEYSAPPEPGSAAAKRLIQVDFTGTVHTALPWQFEPQQRRVVVGLGETALAFYRAKNTSDKPIIGVSVYHMMPPEAGLYFNKIQCFCFDEQLINPNEEVDLPVFFFIDPLMARDSRFDHVDRITLTYLFYESESDLPEGYEDFIKAVPSEKTPPGEQLAPAPA